MQEYEKAEERTEKMKKTKSSGSSNSINKCIDQVFKKNKYRGKYVKITIEKKNMLKEWLTKNSQPTSNDFILISQTLEEPLENVQKWYRNQKKTNKDIKKGVPKTKRILSKEEEEILEKAFRNNIKPKPEKYKELAKKIIINSKQIRKWFKYRRRKLKKLYNEEVPMPSSQTKGKTIDSSESSYKTSNSSPNISTNDLKSQKNNSSSDSNQMHKSKEKMANNQQESIQKKPENSNIQMNTIQQQINIPNNYNNIYQTQNNMNIGQNCPQMFFTYPLIQTNIEPPQQAAIPIIPQNNIYRIIQNSMTPVVYLPNPQTPFYINNNGLQQIPVLIKNAPNVQNYVVNPTQPQFVLMNNRNNEFFNQNKPMQASNNNNIIYLKQNNECPALVANQNMMPNLGLIQNLQILQPQNQGYGHPQNFSNNSFMNNGVYQMNNFNNHTMNMKINKTSTNSTEKLQTFNEDHKMEKNRD